MGHSVRIENNQVLVLQIDIRPPLFPNRRDGFIAQVRTAERTGAMGRIERGVVGKLGKLVLPRVVPHFGKGRRAHAVAHQVGTADVADEERVAGEYECRVGFHRRVVNVEASAVRRVARGGRDDRTHRAEGDGIAVLDRLCNRSKLRESRCATAFD